MSWIVKCASARDYMIFQNKWNINYLCCFILGLLMNQTVLVCGGLLQDNQPTKECYSLLGNYFGNKISMIEARAFAASTVFNHVSTLI